ncbi:MFS general substrate transporter [Pleurotus eryngii]|uniref:MFS general substrate transporter n=1 Tax=Pleurotus eryngii TaxID=5323 RepID=A0A9P6DFD9_PLEER|nr:MFS general substrate transporter [Pleurotus eryngii]
MSSVHQPLLQDEAGDANKGPRRLGPLEITRSTRYAILAGIWTATFLSSLNGTLVPTMLPSISSDFNKSNQASWLGTSYLLATCTFTPLYGRLCNVLGRKGANQTAVLFACLGTLACGLSTNMEMLIAARFISGIGGGGIFTTSSIVISDMYSMRSRGLAQGVASVFNGLGMGLGGPFGGIITDWLGWRAAFLIQIPMFMLAFALTSFNLNYTTPGKSRSAKDVLRRIDYGGSLTLLVTVGSLLFFLATKYNEGLPWSDPSVIASVVVASVFAVLFLVVELFIAPEPVLAPSLLRQKIPVLVGMSNFLVATCNFSVMYFFPMWFQTVMLTSASTAGLHLFPNSISMSIGSMFAGWWMHRTGRYKFINITFGACPFIATVLITRMQESSGPLQLWLSIIPLGFGNAVVLQTVLIALLAHLPESQMAIGTGFGQLFRGIGQVGGVAVSSAIFQQRLDSELRARITGPNAEEWITKIRHSAKLVGSLPPDMQRTARDAYAISLKQVFIFASVATLFAYLVRLPIPEKPLEHQPRPIPGSSPNQQSPTLTSIPETPFDSEDDEDEDEIVIAPGPKGKIARRLSGYESADGVMDLESNASRRLHQR